MILWLGLIFSVLINLRNEISNHFTILPGDRYDGLIGIANEEHWYQVFKLNASWSKAGWEYPYSRTIAQGDAEFLNGVLYAPFRALGFDSFLSAELSNILLKSIGYFSLYCLLKFAFKMQRSYAVLGAILFSIANSMTIHSSRYELASVAIAPLISLLIYIAISSLAKGKSTMALVAGILSGFIFGCWLVTCFYMCWFYALFTLIFLGFICYVHGFKLSLNLFSSYVKKYPRELFAISTSWLISSIPFIYLFLPKSLEVGTRSYSGTLSNTVQIPDFVQLGKDNFLWGNIYNNLFLKIFDPNYVANGEYYNCGVSPLLIFIFVACGAYIFKSRKSLNNSDRLSAALILTIATCFILLARVAGHSLWILPFYLMPGGKALNAVSTFLIFLIFPIIVVSLKYLAFLPQSKLKYAIVALLIVGELNNPYLNLNRSDELSRFSNLQSPPKLCQAFWVGGWKNQDTIPGFPKTTNELYAHNVSAMYIATHYNLPTLNGFVSFSVPDWNFQYFDKKTYEQNVTKYIQNHKLLNVCYLDLNTMTWATQ